MELRKAADEASDAVSSVVIRLVRVESRIRVTNSVNKMELSLYLT